MMCGTETVANKVIRYSNGTMAVSNLSSGVDTIQKQPLSYSGNESSSALANVIFFVSVFIFLN